jgi:EAL domain-containing protein (putative c-di-GMP-specific phosphodiesterase class I)
MRMSPSDLPPSTFARQALLRQRAELAVALQRAIESRTLHVEYQPELAMDGRLLGFEALVRWYRPDRGLVPVADFLPLAASAGLMQRLGELVLDSVCEQMARWLDAGADLPRVAVNLGVRDLEREDLAEQVLATLRRHRVPAEGLVLEATETDLLLQQDRACEQLALLRRHGVQVALDDFGTGYSSLATLVALPVDALKIDRSFLRGVPGDLKREQVLHTVVRMACDLGLRITAEGVEQREQLAWLARCGVTAFQGFLFHGAAPAGYWTPLLCEERRHLTGWETTQTLPFA